MIEKCRASIDELRHDESQVEYDDLAVDYRNPVLEDGAHWIKDANDVLVSIQSHALTRETIIEFGDYAFTQEQARKIGELLINLASS